MKSRGRRQLQRGESSAKPGAVTDPADAEGRQRRLTWLWPQSCWGSQLIRKVYEIDPLLCPYCGANMRMAVPPVVMGVAFLIDFASLRRILAHLGFAPQQPEPLAHSPPVETELCVFNA